jgi:RES domain-containing protein
LGYGLAPARWNLYGVPIIYASSGSSLCFLEHLSIKGGTVSASKWLLITIKIDIEVSRIEADDLPLNWQERPYPESTQQIGSDWAQRQLSPFLKVPSIRIPVDSYPDEHNLLINPLHPDFMKSIASVTTTNVGFELN